MGVHVGNGSSLAAVVAVVISHLLRLDECCCEMAGIHTDTHTRNIDTHTHAHTSVTTHTYTDTHTITDMHTPTLALLKGTKAQTHTMHTRNANGITP